MPEWYIGYYSKMHALFWWESTLLKLKQLQIKLYLSGLVFPSISTHAKSAQNGIDLSDIDTNSMDIVINASLLFYKLFLRL